MHTLRYNHTEAALIFEHAVYAVQQHSSQYPQNYHHKPTLLMILIGLWHDFESVRSEKIWMKVETARNRSLLDIKTVTEKLDTTICSILSVMQLSQAVLSQGSWVQRTRACSSCVA